MELRHIRYFVRAAELLHFTHAAESLYISQPTLSTHIQQLEEELGLPVFERTGRTVRLTEAGKIFLARAQSALHHLEVAGEKITGFKELTHGTLRIGALLTFGAQLLPEWLAAYNKLYPNIRVVVQTGSSDFIEDKLTVSEIDIGLSFVPPLAPENVQSAVIVKEQVFLVVSSEHELAKQESIDPSQLNDLPLILVSKQWAARRMYDAFLHTHKVNPNIVIETDDLHFQLHIVSKGLVATLLPRIVVGKRPGLTVVPINGESPVLQYGILWNAQRALSPAAHAFRDLVLERNKGANLIEQSARGQA